MRELMTNTCDSHHCITVSSPPVSWCVVGGLRNMAAVATSRWMLHIGGG